MAGKRKGGEFDTSSIDAVSFDYGGTLVPYGPEEIGYIDRQVWLKIDEFAPGTNIDEWLSLMWDYRDRPFRRDHIENEPRSGIAENLEVLLEEEPGADLLNAVLDRYHTAFVEVIKVPPLNLNLVESLSDVYRIGFLSNYSQSSAIFETLDSSGLIDHLNTIVVSGDVGFVKPHIEPFRRLSEGLGVQPDRILYVGDTWLCDIQGAKEYGMKAGLTTEYRDTRDEFSEGDFEPDLIVSSIKDLAWMLLDD